MKISLSFVLAPLRTNSYGYVHITNAAAECHSHVAIASYI